MNEDERADREAIRVVMAQYNIDGDRSRVASLAALFLPDGKLHFSGSFSTGPAEIEARLGVKNRNPALTLSRHHLTTSLIELDGAQAQGRSYFQVLTDIGLDHHGVYVDLLEKQDGRWWFKDRQVRIDWQSPHSLFTGLHVRGRKPDAPG
jgi:hypothetical protein